MLLSLQDICCVEASLYGACKLIKLQQKQISRERCTMDKKIAVARCHEIQLAVRGNEVSRFESISEIGMAVQLSLHLRGLPQLEYERIKLLASALLGIPRLAVERIVRLLEKIGFVKVVREGRTAQSLVPLVPYFDALYDGVGEYLETEGSLDEFEILTLEIVDRLAAAPHNVDSLAAKIGAVGNDRKTFDASIGVGQQGNFLVSHRSRSQTILLNPTYFSENAELFADHVAKCGATGVSQLLKLIHAAQGWPLSVIEQRGEINGFSVSAEQILLLRRLAQEGMVKPPKITTSYSGESIFMFTPTPGYMNVSPLKREQYERALAIVSAVRQGQLLPHKFAIRKPGALLYRLKTDLQLSPTTDYGEQYQNLVHLRLARLVPVGNGYQQLQIIDTPENRQSIEIAYQLVTGGVSQETVVDKDVIEAMTGPQEYMESLISSQQMRARETITVPGESGHEMQQLILQMGS